MKTIYLVRHGESETNAGGLILGGMKNPLTDKGLQQASFVAERCAQLPIEIIISSPYLRTKQTAEVIAKRIGKPIEYSELFVEWDRGSARIGKQVLDTSIQEQDRLLFGHLSDSDWRMADEENFEDLNARAASTLAYLSARREEHILLAGHGMFMRVLLGRALMGENFTGQDCRHFLIGFLTKNTGISVLTYDSVSKERWSPWKIVTWNDHAHLG